MGNEVRLLDAPLGTALSLSPGSVPEDAGRRLAMLGLRPGVTFQLLGRTTGGGRVARVGQTRVALGAGLCHSLRVTTAAA